MFSFAEVAAAIGAAMELADAIDTNPTGLETEGDVLENNDPFETEQDLDDVQADDVSENIGDEEIKFDDGEINEVDEDPDSEDTRGEPDWEPADDVDDEEDWWEDATDISNEMGEEDADTELDDNPWDEWEEVTPDDEINQWDDIIQDDNISQLEETGYDEPLWYEDDDENDLNPIDDIEEDIYINTEDYDESLAPVFTSSFMGQLFQEVDDWANEVAIDFTQLDTPVDDTEAIELADGYDPPVMDFMSDDMLLMPDLTDDVFIDVLPDDTLGVDFFGWMDAFDPIT